MDHFSPSKKYKLIVTSHPTKKGCWNYTKGSVYLADSNQFIIDVERNYSSFPFLFIENHSDGFDYLVCGADYQGQTVIRLNNGKRRDFVPKEANGGAGFCWADYRFDLVSNILIVAGCIWACPYEYRFYDFSNPMLGWPEIKYEDDSFDDYEKWPSIENGIIKTYQTNFFDDDDSEEDIDPEQREVVATKTLKRDGLKLVLVDEWISEEEKDRRLKRDESLRKFHEWWANFKATDSLFLKYLELVKDSIFLEYKYDGIGQTYEGWCPYFHKNESRICRRIIDSSKNSTPKDYTIDLEWAAETGPIKLIIYSDGKHSEDKWFEHNIEGMTQAFDYARYILKNEFDTKIL